MNHKQLKKFAKQVAELEYKLRMTEDKNEINALQNKIMSLTEEAHNDMTLDDMLEADGMIMAILEEKLKS